MIWDALFGLLRGLAASILGLLPGVSLDPIEIGSFTVPTAVVSAVFPLDHLLAALGALLVWMVICHGYRLVLWILGVIHMSGDSV